MNWYKKSKEAASVVHVSPRYQGKDTGTSGARPMQISDNSRIFNNGQDLSAMPEHWQTLPPLERSQYINRETRKGRTHFPFAARDFAEKSLEADPSPFLYSLFICFQQTGRFPDYAASWIQRKYRDGSLPPELKKIMDNTRKSFPLQNNGVNLLVEDQKPNAPIPKMKAPQVKEMISKDYMK